MEVHCIKCRRRISRQFMEQHQRGPRCSGDAEARVLLSEPYNAVPFPIRNDLPNCIPRTVHVTRARYEGQRLDESGALIPGSSSCYKQVWVPAWVEVIVDAWRRLGLAHKNRRDWLLCALHKLRMNDELNVFLRRPGVSDTQIIVLAVGLVGGTSTWDDTRTRKAE